MFHGYLNTHLPYLKLSIVMIGPVSTLLITDDFPYMYVVVMQFRDRRRRTDRCAHGGGVPFGCRAVYNVYVMWDCIIYVLRCLCIFCYVLHDDAGWCLISR